MAFLPMDSGKSEGVVKTELITTSGRTPDGSVPSGGTRSGSYTLDRDCIVIFNANLSYTASGFSYVYLNGSAVLSTTSRGNYYVYMKTKKGDNFSWDLNSASASYYYLIDIFE